VTRLQSKRLSTTRHAATLWNLLSDRDLRVGVVSVPMTYPPEQVNGVMVTDMMTPNAQVQYTYPPELKDQVDAGKLWEHRDLFGVLSRLGLRRSRFRTILVGESNCRRHCKRQSYSQNPYFLHFCSSTILGVDNLPHLALQLK
jgi:predicted AlkP superfamily phosphohydrolase/phosphomutase